MKTIVLFKISLLFAYFSNAYNDFKKVKHIPTKLSLIFIYGLIIYAFVEFTRFTTWLLMDILELGSIDSIVTASIACVVVYCVGSALKRFKQKKSSYKLPNK